MALYETIFGFDYLVVTGIAGGQLNWIHEAASYISLQFYQRSTLLFRILRIERNETVTSDIEPVLKSQCSSYRLRYQLCNEEGARAAIVARRPVIATFALDDNHWEKFVAFYKRNPKGTLTANGMRPQHGGEIGGHAGSSCAM
jgi:hypothetical protein